jgi:hypothetical protein
MLLNIITLLTALALASVAAWFSIIGFTTIYAGAITAAIVMGIVAECGKVVATSWLYRNWEFTSWLLKVPLTFFILVLMIITSLGVFGFLSKAHLDQGAGTINNAARIEQLDYQISREQLLIEDAEKVIAQLDSAVNALVDAKRIDRSISLRRSQAATRQQLREDISFAQERINQLNQEKFSYESEIRNLELEIGPVKYIAELIYGNQEINKDITKSAVQLFTLLIVITLDPLAIFLLIASNQSMLRSRKEKVNKEKNKQAKYLVESDTEQEYKQTEKVHVNEHYSTDDHHDELPANQSRKIDETYNSNNKREILKPQMPTNRSVVNPWATQEEVLRELVGNAKPDNLQENSNSGEHAGKKYPEIRSWFEEFKGTKDGRKQS